MEMEGMDKGTTVKEYRHPAEPMKERRLQEYLDEMEKAIEFLHQNIENFSSKLAPVLREMSAPADPDMAPKIDESDAYVTRRIKSMTARVSVASNFINALIYKADI